MRNQLSSLVLSGKIVTTLPKAKLLKSEMEKLISNVRKLEGINKTRKIAGILYGGAKAKMADEYDSYRSVSLYKTVSRFGDGAPLSQVVIEKNSNKPKELKKEKTKNGKN